MLQATSVNRVMEASAARTAPALQVRDLTVAYNGRPALWSVDYETPASGLVAIVGPNGAGKSTFIKACLGLVTPLSGEVRILGEPIARVRRDVGYVPQRGSVDWDFPVSALDVVSMGRYGRVGIGRRLTRADREAALGALSQVGLADLAQRQIGELSGGQQQRVFLARALAQDSQLYFMDEPFAGVDAATERAILDLLRKLDHEKRTVVCVHHDLQTVADFFDHVLLLNRTKVAAGPVATTLTDENLERAYGGRLAQGAGTPRAAVRP
jgi:manganese/zinc/iron transport system ATP- binding protein